jgi:hypothetical protein
MFFFIEVAGAAWAATFGQRPFSYTPPTGYVALNTYNLPASTAPIPNGAKYMAATLYTGNATSSVVNNSVNGVSFQPDFVWIKSRGTANQHNLIDSVRGTSVRLRSDGTNADEATPGTFTLNSNGFTTTTSNVSFNASGDPLVGWQWKAGTTSASNTNGSITSTVSVGATQGFSVVTYTGDGTNPGATIGHGLGVAPSFIITKSRSGSGEWPSYHAVVGVTNTIYLNATYASSTYINRFSAVSASTFTTGSNGSELNTNGVTYVAYCFAAVAGYSAFGSYTGNGSTDGPFVYTGFRPRFVMIKRTDSSPYNWVIGDTSRNTYNIATAQLSANLSDAENTSYMAIDFVSNGFKLRTTDGAYNASGGTYVYACFAENPFKNALAR